MEKLTCSICAEETDDVFHKLKCNHTFHYKCLYLSFKNMKNDGCPYCRAPKNKLPIIHGLKIITQYHDVPTYDNLNNPLPVNCQHVLQRGVNKGNQCSKGCKLGYEFCTMHYKNHIKEDEQVVV